MSKRRSVFIVGLALVAAMLLASPASPATSVSKQIKSLDRKITSINKRLAALIELRELDKENAPQGGVSSRIVTAPVSANAGSSGVATASCSSDEIASGGGVSFSDPQNGDRIIYSRPSGTNAWSAAIGRSSNTYGLGSVYVTCLSSP